MQLRRLLLFANTDIIKSCRLAPPRHRHCIKYDLSEVVRVCSHTTCPLHGNGPERGANWDTPRRRTGGWKCDQEYKTTTNFRLWFSVAWQQGPLGLQNGRSTHTWMCRTSRRIFRWNSGVNCLLEREDRVMSRGPGNVIYLGNQCDYALLGRTSRA